MPDWLEPLDIVSGALQVLAKSVERECFKTLLSCQHW